MVVSSSLIWHVPEHSAALATVGSAKESLETVSQYPLAPLTGDQEKLGFCKTPVAPLDGANRFGAGNRDCNVVKLRLSE